VQRDLLLRSLERLTGADRGDKNQKSTQDRLKQVLIIDDESASRYILVRLIQDQPYLLRQATNGTDGFRMAKEIQPVFILLDLNMPDISGFDLLDKLKADPDVRKIPVAIVTSLILNEADRRRLEAQACAILSKSELSRERMEQLFANLRSDVAANILAS
jgi:CheY-like chemotaxis protein